MAAVTVSALRVAAPVARVSARKVAARARLRRQGAPAKQRTAAIPPATTLTSVSARRRARLHRRARAEADADPPIPIARAARQVRPLRQDFRRRG